MPTTTAPSHDPGLLLYRRQFVLGPTFLQALGSWKKVQVRSGICISVHPDLNVHQAFAGSCSLTLLGYAVDATDPEADHGVILDRLLGSACSGVGFRTWVQETDRLAGRWIMILDDGRDVTLCHDAIGLRQVFHTDLSTTSELWCASQPGILADYLGLEMDPRAVAEFMGSDAYRAWEEYVWPAGTSPYRELRRLQPNHSLDLRTGKVSRYWPARPLGSRTLKQGARAAADLLRRIVRGASSRFELAHSISAGWDSRLLLAASREVCSRVYYFTLDRGADLADVHVTPRLLSRLGLEDHVVRIAPSLTDEFREIFMRNVTLAHEFNGRFAQPLLDAYPKGRLCMTGNAAEITRVRFRVPEGKLTSRWLARFTSFQFPDQMERIPFVLDAWERWLARLGEIRDVHPLDIFYWDHWGGNFAATDQLELDVVYDTFTPYSCRDLLATMLSVDEVFRDHDHPILYEDMIRELWPAVLIEPLNPAPTGRFTSDALRAMRLRANVMLRRAGLYPLARVAYRSARRLSRGGRRT